MSETYIIAGGDRRFTAAAERLAAKGKNVVTVFQGGGDNAEPSDHLILPVPVSADGIYLNAPAAGDPPPLSVLPRYVKNGGTVFGGRLTENIRNIFSEKNTVFEDYMEREELSVMNALATAEGAVMEALRRQDIMLHRQKVLIIGMGRIAKSLIGILKGFGADITVAARRSDDLAWADIMGCRTVRISDIADVCGEFTLIYNTAPAMILNESIIKKISRKAYIIDLASAPGGTDLKAAKHWGINAINFTGIPGKTAPESAGCLIADAVLNIVGEKQ